MVGTSLHPEWLRAIQDRQLLFDLLGDCPYLLGGLRAGDDEEVRHGDHLAHGDDDRVAPQFVVRSTSSMTGPVGKRHVGDIGRCLGPARGGLSHWVAEAIRLGGSRLR